MTIVSSTTTLVNDDSAVTLPRYAQLIEYSECAFMGVNAASTAATCRVIWTKPERDMVLKYLLEAQQEIETILGYPLTRRWFTDEQHPYRVPLKARWCEVVEGGVRAVSNIALNSLADHTADPAIIGPIATTVTDVSEVHVYHPGTDYEIHPSAITIAAGGNVTIRIPRCRMVKTALADNDPGGLDYADLLNFEARVDVKRVYNNAATQATLVWPHGETCYSCGETTETACVTVRSGELGIVDVLPATYANGTWNYSRCGCCGPSYARLNYRAGLAAITRQHEDAIIRLAHSKMPFEPCKCDLATRVWQRDRHTPEVLTAERLNCPFGLADGSWIAWRFANALRYHRGAIL